MNTKLRCSFRELTSTETPALTFQQMGCLSFLRIPSFGRFSMDTERKTTFCGAPISCLSTSPPVSGHLEAVSRFRNVPFAKICRARLLLPSLEGWACITAAGPGLRKWCCIGNKTDAMVRWLAPEVCCWLRFWLLVLEGALSSDDFEWNPTFQKGRLLVPVPSDNGLSEQCSFWHLRICAFTQILTQLSRRTTCRRQPISAVPCSA